MTKLHERILPDVRIKPTTVRIPGGRASDRATVQNKVNKSHIQTESGRTMTQQKHCHGIVSIKWATSRENVSSGIFDHVHSNQPAQLQKLARILKLWIKQVYISYYLSSEQKCWSDCADAQADLRLCCSHIAQDTFSHELAHLITEWYGWGLKPVVRSCNPCHIHVGYSVFINYSVRVKDFQLINASKQKTY